MMEYDAGVLARLQKLEISILRDFIQICDKYGISWFAVAGTAIGALREGGMIPWDDDIDVAMLRADYQKFKKAAKAEFGEKYTLRGPDTDRPYYNFIPHMSRNGTRFIVDVARAADLDTGVFMDIFIFDNIPDQKIEAVRVIRKAWMLRNMYLLAAADYFKMPRPASPGKRALYTALGVYFHAVKLLGIDRNVFFRRFLRLTRKYAGRTDTYTILGDPYAEKMILRHEDLFPTKQAEFEGLLINLPNHCDKMLKKRYGDYMKRPAENNRTNHAPLHLDLGRE